MHTQEQCVEIVNRAFGTDDGTGDLYKAAIVALEESRRHIAYLISLTKIWRHGAEADHSHLWKHVKTIDDVRKFVRRERNSGIATAWGEMLRDMDENGATHPMEDFYEEATIQAADGNF